MKKKLLCTALIFILAVNVMGQDSIGRKSVQTVFGLCVDSCRMYYLTGRKIHCQQISSNVLIRTKDLAQDTLIVHKIFKKAVTLYGITGDSAVKACKTQIGKFRLMNVSHNKHSVYVGIMFQTSASEKSQHRYAILQFDTTLTFRNYYIIRPFSSQEYSSFSPFQSFEFSDNKFVLKASLVILDSSVFTYGGYDFRKDRNELIFFYHSVNYFNLPLSISVDATNRSLLSPTIYPVPNSASIFFYAFPYPYLYDVRKHNDIDPYHIKGKLDSLSRYPDSKNLYTYSTSLAFESTQARDKNVILSTNQTKDQIYMAVSNADVLKIDIVKCDLKTHEIKILTLDIPLTDNYFMFNNSKLYYLNDSDGKRVIKEIDLTKLKF